MAHWDPTKYLQFGSQRLRPALDLLAQIPIQNPSTIIDLGCGPGNVTGFLKDRWPDAAICGVDTSSDMLAKAKDAHPDVEWVEADVASWSPDDAPDLIYSNACLHWLDDHWNLFPRLVGILASGGVLAVQMPNNFDQPTHRLIEDVLGEGHPLAPGFPVHGARDYYEWLRPLSDSVEVWETTYTHVLDGENPVADWTKGAALRPVLEGLNTDEDRRQFEEEYRARIAKAYPKLKNGQTLMPFKRLFMVAVKA